MSDAKCEECGKELRVYEVFGDLWHTYCMPCWRKERPEESERTPAWYRDELMYLKGEEEILRRALSLLEEKHKHLHGEYFQHYDMFGIRREADKEEEE